jgi:general secretion pathway protein N
VALIAVVFTTLVLAPAQWVAGAMHSVTHGRVELAEATGTAWNGEATLVLSSGPEEGAARASLPERLRWRLSPWQLIVGAVDLTVSHPSALEQPLTARVGIGRPLVLSASTLRLPASLLTGLGAPWNTIRPGGLLTLSWDRLEIGQGSLKGGITGEWQMASSSFSPVSPFGHYRMRTNGVFPGTQLELETISGPLEMTGSGTITPDGFLRFQGIAQPLAGTDPAVKTQLTGLLSLLGRRRGDTAILSFGS